MTYKILETSSDENHVFFSIEYMIKGKTYQTRRGFRKEDNKTEQEIKDYLVYIGDTMEQEINDNEWQNKIINWFKNKIT